MYDDSDLLPDRERARIRSRDRKVRGPRVVVDNPGLKKLALHLAARRRATERQAPAPARRAGSPATAKGRSPRGRRRRPR